MTSEKIRDKFIGFFKKNKHILVPSSSLWPHDDPTVLLTTAGMQQFKPYFLGSKNSLRNFKSNRLTSVQRCFRTSDIDEVGDATHCTFFEMLGNFSVGDYFKSEAIDLAWKFLTKEIRLNKERLWVTYFQGDDLASSDQEAAKLWEKYLPTNKIIGFGRSENWWGPPGTSGPCGPCSELHYDFTGKPCALGDKCLPNCTCGRFMELWNLVFMEYNQSASDKLKELPSKNIDTGMGLERLALVLQKKRNIYETDLFENLLELIANDKNFGEINEVENLLRARIVADHLKSTIFLLADGISFSNKEQGYILRRVFRRALDQFLFTNFNLNKIFDQIFTIYQKDYPFLLDKRELIFAQINRELEAYKKVLSVDIESAVKKIKPAAVTNEHILSGPSARHLTAQEAFQLYSTYGLSPDRLKRNGFTFDVAEFDQEIAKHQSLSRASAQKKFGGHGLDSGQWSAAEQEKMTKLHTATHLLHQALRQILGDHVKQQGSDINPERLRFDFSHPEKLSDEQIGQIEELVNKQIQLDLPVTKLEMDYNEAIKNGALAFFKEKYPETVTVYAIGDFSKEVCGGPHISHTSQIGKFKITSEKSSSAGIRRIKATVED